MAAGFSGLTVTAEPVVVNNATSSADAPEYALNSNLATGAVGTGSVVVGIFDPISTERIFNPTTEAVIAASDLNGVTVSDYLPTLAAITPVQVTDYLNGGDAPFGMIEVQLTPGPKNTVEAASVMTYRVSSNAYVLTTSTATFA